MPDVTISDRPEIIEWRQQDKAIARLAEEYLPLRIDGLNDKVGFKKVHDARMVVKSARVAVEKKRKELKADALAYGKAVDDEAKRLTSLLAPIEEHLESEEDAIEAEKQRLQKIKEDAWAAHVKTRTDALTACNAVFDPVAVSNATEQSFQDMLSKAKAAQAERERLAKVESDRLAAEAEARRLEAEKLAAERAELDRVRKEQQAEAERLRAEQKKLDDAAAARQREADLEAARKKAADAAVQQEKDRVAREQAEAKARADEQEAARVKAESERPQREKYLAIADQLDEIVVPDGPRADSVVSVLNNASHSIRAIANGRLS